MNRINEYILYHIRSGQALDIDPQVEAIRYICDRFELSQEQRFWLCFLFSTNYCVPTTYFMYNEFPDFQTCDVARLQRWWDENRAKLIFQTDRAWIRSRNQFVGVFESYRDFIRMWSAGTMSQENAIINAVSKGATPFDRYEELNLNFKVAQFGRFAMFLYSELLYAVCGMNIGVKFDIREAESSRNGLVFALGMEDQIPGRTGKTLEGSTIATLNRGLAIIVAEINRQPILARHKTLWSIETTLCAFKKHKLNGKRYVGYYIERMRKEIEKLQAATSKEAGGGVEWLPLWQFREETYRPRYLKEKQ